MVELGLQIGEPFWGDDDVLRHVRDLYSRKRRRLIASGVDEKKPAC
jgi:hypothetical protein